eukprot:3609999-Pleurochrysis_carterae.AAC.2
MRVRGQKAGYKDLRMTSWARKKKGATRSRTGEAFENEDALAENQQNSSGVMEFNAESVSPIDSTGSFSRHRVADAAGRPLSAEDIRAMHVSTFRRKALEKPQPSLRAFAEEADHE